MNESLDLDVVAEQVADLRDLVEARLASENDPLCAHVGIDLCCILVGDVRLRGDVYVERRSDLAAQLDRAEVGDDRRVDAALTQKAEVIGKRAKVGVAGEHIDRGVQFFAALMRVCDSLGHLLCPEICRACPQPEIAAADIDGVRSEMERGDEFGHVARRREQLYAAHIFVHTAIPPPTSLIVHSKRDASVIARTNRLIPVTIVRCL